MGNHDSDVPRISVWRAKKLYDAGDSVFIDVRDHEKYEQSHIPGAVSMPLREVPRRLAKIAPQTALVFY